MGINETVKEIIENANPDCDLIPTIGGRYQRHPRNMVGNLYRIKNPDSVRIGNCFLEGRLKKGDLFLCTQHSGDCFQSYIYVKEYSDCLESRPQWSFGSYGIGDSEIIELKDGEFDILKGGGRVERTGKQHEGDG